jgi:hypothetical protein
VLELVVEAHVVHPLEHLILVAGDLHRSVTAAAGPLVVPVIHGPIMPSLIVVSEVSAIMGG